MHLKGKSRVVVTLMRIIRQMKMRLYVMTSFSATFLPGSIEEIAASQNYTKSL
jgi:hypothetical protein